MLKILSLGAGVQSTCVLLMSCRGILPKLDAAIFADTQWEPKAVYKHLAWLRYEAEMYDIPVHEVTTGNLRFDALEGRRAGGRAGGGPRYANIPMFLRNPDGTIGMINRQCTDEYKSVPVEKFIRQKLLGLAPRQKAPSLAVEHWFGISADEKQRMRRSKNHWQTFYYPLIHGVVSPRQDTLFGRGFDRRDCLDWIEANGYPTPPRSACVGCPFHTDAEWVRLRDTCPEEWADAVAFDRDIREADAALKIEGKKLRGKAFLHRSCVPLDKVVFNAADTKAAFTFGMGNECAGVCGV